MDVFVKPDEQRRACSYIVMARIGIANTELWAKWKGKTHFSRNDKKSLNQELGIGQYEIYIQPFVDYFKKTIPKPLVNGFWDFKLYITKYFVLYYLLYYLLYSLNSPFINNRERANASFANV